MNKASDHGPRPIGLPTSQTVEVPARDGQRGLISTTTEIPGAALTRGRLLWPDEAYSDFACLRCGANRLTLRDIDQREPAPKVHMVGHLRFVKALAFGRERPRIVTWVRLPVEAVNMDGGGSSQVFFLSGLATVPGGRLGLQSVYYERLVPSVGVVR